MNRLRSLLTVIAVALFAVACGKDTHSPEVEYLDVTANNIRGNWQLQSWNGAAIMEGTYMYLAIERDMTYAMYQNLDSFQNLPRTITGEYYLYDEDSVGTVIRGNYDHTGYEWSSRYIIKNLTSDSMIWADKNNPEKVQKFVRIEKIPVIE